MKKRASVSLVCMALGAVALTLSGAQKHVWTKALRRILWGLGGWCRLKRRVQMEKFIKPTLPGCLCSHATATPRCR